jgi:4-diphosphocytidyl-2-C-methyl-D-erythritol kinase
MSQLQTPAAAKINLMLRVLARRPDGLHELASLVAFATVGDHLTLEPSGTLDLEISGPMAAAAGTRDDNLVLRAAESLAERFKGLQLGRFVLEKRLPAGAGLGGGSADAAAALRLLAEANELPAGDGRLFDAARDVGADVAVCIESRARLIHGVGDELSPPLTLPQLDTVLAFPGVGVSTSDVFRACPAPGGRRTARYSLSEISTERGRLLEFLADEENDLEPTATSIVPAIADARACLERAGNPRLVRMTGSGSTVFAIHDDAVSAENAAAKIREYYPDWWVVATKLS